jgi:peptidyl-tRNA hydrolase
VLSRPSRSDEYAIVSALEDAAGALPEILDGQFQKAMHRLHSRAST